MGRWVVTCGRCGRRTRSNEHGGDRGVLCPDCQDLDAEPAPSVLDGPDSGRRFDLRTLLSAVGLASVLSTFAIAVGTLATQGVAPPSPPSTSTSRGHTPAPPEPPALVAAGEALGSSEEPVRLALASEAPGDRPNPSQGRPRADQPPPPPSPSPEPAPPPAPQPLKGNAAQSALHTADRSIPSPSLRGTAVPPPPPAPVAHDSAEKAGPSAKRIRVRTDNGKITVARVHGMGGNRVSVLLPDGQIRFAASLVETTDPFVPATADEMKDELSAGPYAGFSVLKKPHYLVFYQSSTRFAEASAQLLEDLYKGLKEALRKHNVPTHEAEFPLVAVIFRNEADFRAHRPVAPEVQAYYEIMTNRIYFYQSSDRDQLAPELSAMRRPQTVAHEGTHQILANIGVQPRQSAWPLWLIEGLAEYCSPPVTTRKGGVVWKGLGVVNPMHMATIRDLEDPLSTLVPGAKGPRVGREPGTPLVEYLVTRTELTPTDYALAWATTHYLAMKKADAFVAFLKTMSRMPPLEKRSPEEHLAAFRAAFGSDLAKLDKAIGTHLSKLKCEQLPYFAVVFEQWMPTGRIKRGAMVSQSPSVIRQWVETMTTADGQLPHWEAYPFPTRARAVLSAEQWLQNH